MSNQRVLAILNEKTLLRAAMTFPRSWSTRSFLSLYYQAMLPRFSVQLRLSQKSVLHKSSNYGDASLAALCNLVLYRLSCPWPSIPAHLAQSAYSGSFRDVRDERHLEHKWGDSLLSPRALTQASKPLCSINLLTHHTSSATVKYECRLLPSAQCGIGQCPCLSARSYVVIYGAALTLF